MFIRCIAIESLIELANGASGITDGQMTTMYSKVPVRGCAEWVCPVGGEGPFSALWYSLQAINKSNVQR